jgi:hypothetical protein
MTRKALKMTEKHVSFFTKRVLRVGFVRFYNKTAVEWQLIIGMRPKKASRDHLLRKCSHLIKTRAIWKREQ